MDDTILHPGWKPGPSLSLSHALSLTGPKEGAVHGRGSRPGKGKWTKTIGWSVGLGNTSYLAG